MNKILFLVAVLAVFSSTAAAQASATAKPAPISNSNSLRQWKDDFSDPSSFENHWVPYGRLADGTWAQGVEGYWPKTEKTVFARPEWNRLVDGALRQQNFPDEKHAAGLSSKAAMDKTFNETGIRVSWRIKLGEGAKGTLKFFGLTPSKDSKTETDSHMTALDVSASGLRAWQGNRIFVPDPAVPPIADGQTAGPRFRNHVVEKKADVFIEPNSWQALVMEVHGHDLKVSLNDKCLLIYQFECEQPLRSLSLEASGDGKSIGTVWWDDIVLKTLTGTPPVQ